MLIFENNVKIKTNQNKTNIKFNFNVDKNIKALKITCSYSPKVLADEQAALNEALVCLEKYGESLLNAKDNLPIKNLVTLSLDSPSGYRGAAHRQDSEQIHILRADAASPGFIKGDIDSGVWSAVLNVHSISCDVDYKIKVEGEEY